MAAKTKLTVESSYGTFTRTTTHDYQFVVVRRGRQLTVVDREFKEQETYLLAQVVQYAAIVEGRATVPSHCTWDLVKEWLANARSKLEGLPVQRAAALERWAEDNVSGEWYADSWSGTLANASKAAARARDYAHSVKVLDRSGKEV